jgi:hypothetical protein
VIFLGMKTLQSRGSQCVNFGCCTSSIYCTSDLAIEHNITWEPYKDGLEVMRSWVLMHRRALILCNNFNLLISRIGGINIVIHLSPWNLKNVGAQRWACLSQGINHRTNHFVEHMWQSQCHSILRKDVWVVLIGRTPHIMWSQILY